MAGLERRAYVALMPQINPRQMVWARETAGLTRERAAKLLKISEDRLNQLEESGEPSSSQLAAMVKLYRRPLLAFYLPEPPAPSDNGEDFRSASIRIGEPEAEARLSALLRDVRTRQLLIRNILSEDEEAEPVKLIGSLGRNVPPVELLAEMQKIVRVDVDYLRRQRSAEEVFKVLRQAVERLGVFVLLAGDLGSHHTAIDTGTFRGFALSDNLAPFIVINDKDAKTAWSFTLLHELAHLLTGASGVSGSSLGDTRIERLCNDVAGQFLLPDTEVDNLASSITDKNDPQQLFADVIRFSSERWISPDLIAYRLLRRDQIRQPIWLRVQQLLSNRLIQIRQERAEGPDEPGGANYYSVRRHRLGGLVSFARRALEAGVLSPTKAALVLGVKPRNVRALVESG